LKNSVETFKENSFEHAVLDLQNNEKIELATFHTLYTILKQGGTIEVHFSLDNKAPFNDFLTIAGFQLDKNQGEYKVSGKKPQWAGNGVASLKKNKLTPTAITNEPEKTFKVELQSNQKLVVENSV